MLTRLTRRLETFVFGSPSFSVRPGEPIVISYPKSGRTWLRYMLAELGVSAAYTHGPKEGLRIDVERMLRNRVVHLRRDPRDTVVSAWFHETSRKKRFDGSLEEFLRHPHFGIGAVCAFNDDWLRLAGEPNLLLVTYEDLHRDPAGQLTRVAAHLTGSEPDPAAVAAAVQAGQFPRMRAEELSGRGQERFGDSLTPGDRADPSTFKTRRGVVGGWRDYFDRDDAEYAAAVMSRYSDPNFQDDGADRGVEAGVGRASGRGERSPA